MSMSWKLTDERIANGRRMAAGLAALLLVGLLGGGCGKGGGPPAEMAIDVAVAQPEPTEVEDVLPAVGTVEPDERVVVQPEVSGVIQSIHFEEGQRVKQGDLLFRLDSRKEEALLAQALAERQLAQDNLDRARKLEGTQAISLQEIDQAESTLAVKKATYELEARRLEDRVIRAPFAGVLGPREVSVGQYVQTGTRLVSLVRDAQVKVRFYLPERQLGQLRVGQSGRLRVSAFPDRAFEGDVDLINPEVDPASRTVEARLRVPNPEGLLRSGMFARVEVVVGRRQGALVLPESALVPSLSEFGVFAVEDNRARLRPVTLGVRLPGRVEVRDGVAAGDTIIVAGTQKLVDGMLVKPSEDQAPTVASATPAGGTEHRRVTAE